MRERLSLCSRITFHSKHIKNISVYKAIITGSELKPVRKTLMQLLQRKIHLELGRKVNQVRLFREDIEGGEVTRSESLKLHIENPSWDLKSGR